MPVMGFLCHTSGDAERKRDKMMSSLPSGQFLTFYGQANYFSESFFHLLRCAKSSNTDRCHAQTPDGALTHAKRLFCGKRKSYTIKGKLKVHKLQKLFSRPVLRPTSDLWLCVSSCLCTNLQILFVCCTRL